MLEGIITYLQLIVEPLGLFSKVGGLYELYTDSQDRIYPVEYKGSGNYDYGTNYDFFASQSYFRQLTPYTQSNFDSLIGGETGIERIYNLRLVGIANKDVYGDDNAYIADRILTNVSTALGFDDAAPVLQQGLQAESVVIEIINTSYNNKETLDQEVTDTRFKNIPFDKVFIAVDFTVTVSGPLSCFNLCLCGEDIADYQELIEAKYCTSCSDGIITNQSVTYSQSIPSGNTEALPYQSVVDSDGSTVNNIDYVDAADGSAFTCTPAKELADYTNQELEDGLSLAQRNSLTRLELPKPGESPVVYDTNDLGDNNDGAPSTFLTLDVNNSNGNTNRFEVLGSDVVIDWKLRLYWTKNIQSPARVTWAQHNINSAALTLEGLTGWRLPSVTEYSTILDAYAGDPLNYLPFNIANGTTTGANFAFFTGQTYPFNTSQIYNYVLNSSSRGYRISQTNKTGGGVALYCKSF